MLAVLAVVALASAEATVRGEYIIQATNPKNLYVGMIGNRVTGNDETTAWVIGGNTWTSNLTSQDQLESYLSTTIAGAPVYKLYAADVGKPSTAPVIESGSYADSYDTTFSDTMYDPSNATVFRANPGTTPIITQTHLYLQVKDGNQEPASYFFLISDWKDASGTLHRGWNGVDSIVLSGFWPERGAISHVTIFTVVPEPASMLVWGAIGVAFGVGYHYRRRRRA